MIHPNSINAAIREGSPPIPEATPRPRSKPTRRQRLRQLGFLSAVSIVALSLLVFFVLPYWRAAMNVRSFEIERSLYSYTRMKPYGSFVIRSEQELDRAIAELKSSIKPFVHHKQDEEYWVQHCQRFEDKIRDAKPNFDTESVVIVLTSGYSGSLDVGLSIPRLDDGRLSYSIRVRNHGGATTRDYVERGFVLIVQNDSVAEVEVWEEGEQEQILKVAK